ncbi:unnamed protein product [Brassicogethes aeneus]|uniref:SET domain-containing protein n=1 Tax=Brassicogethes aeneus TaxID=1431903 RepID=A0A9P0B401_BRAAE|nr:unnamed protein product [Brassicogethes aeneus]
MSVCIDSGTVLANVVGTTSLALQNEDISATTQTTTVQLPSEQTDITPQSAPAAKNVAATKLVVPSSTPNTVLQKVVNQPVITVLNSSGPLTVVKSLCVTSGVSSAPQFTLVNSAPLTVANTVGKPPTITLLNGPVTVVKAIPATQNIEKSEAVSNTTTNAPTNVSPPTIMENRGHNVFVKNTCPDSTVPDMPQSHKILTASNFPQANVLANVQNKTANGQRNKLKILSNVQMMPGTSSVGNVLLNKSNNNAQQQRYFPRSKLIGANGTKYLNKPTTPNNVLKSNVNQPLNKSPQRMVYPTHKSQIKTLTPNYVQKAQGIKTLSPQQKPVQMQRSNSGLRTIPPQRPPKMPNKPNYIGKHAVQAQKMRPKMKNAKVTSPYGGGGNHPPPMPEKQLTFNQALTAEIIETLSNKSAAAPNSYPSKHYEILPARYENAYTYQDHKAAAMAAPDSSAAAVVDDKTKSGLDALSLICQAVLLDHNYNATLPPDSPTRSAPPPPIPQSQLNGMSGGGNSMYSPGSQQQAKRRSLPPASSMCMPAGGGGGAGLPNMSNAIKGMGPMEKCQNAMLLGSHQMSMQDEDAASDVSDLSDRKHDTEGEETDTAPEAEAVTNEEHMDHYGDYVTRCICGFLHDDGYMVECDRCKVWQHVQCVVKNKQVPDEYLCEVCDPTKPIEKQKARMIQQQWLRDRQLLAESNKLKKDIKMKETLKQREVISDSDSSDAEHPPHHNNNVVAKRRRRKSESSKQQTATSRRDAAKEAAVARRQKQRRERKTVKRKAAAKPNAKQNAQQLAHSDDEGGGNAENFANQLPQLRQWIEKYEEAVTNHYSPELRARISNIRVNGAHSDQISMQFDCAVQKCRVHTQPLTELKYLVSTVRLPPNTPVVELRGKYMLSTQHRNAGSLTTRQHSQRPGPFLFFYRLRKDNTEVCVDTRTYGNSARFVRRSCRPNAELRHCIEKGVLHLYIVSITDVEKNGELTIKHESHDLAVVGTTRIACACNSPPDECAVNKTSIKKNGESDLMLRKRRGRRTASACVLQEPEPQPPKVKDEPLPEPLSSPEPIKQEAIPVKEEVKVEVKEEKPVVVKEEALEIKEEPLSIKPAKKEIVVKEDPEPSPEKKQPDEEAKEKVEEEEEEQQEEEEEDEAIGKSPPHTPIMTRRSSQYKSADDKEDSRDGHESAAGAAAPPSSGSGGKSKCKKLSREERKLEAILRAIEQMEKAEQRKQEHEAKAQHRRESEPGPNPKEEEKVEPRMKRRRRKGRARTTSTNASTRRNRLNSTDSYMTSGDETMLSPTDNACPSSSSSNRPTTKVDHNDKAVGLLLALSNNADKNSMDKSPMRDVDSNSNSAHSSPETPLSSACLLVQAAVEPLEPGFKFPKTKKGMMNEWLNKETVGNDYDHGAAPSAASFYSPAKNLAALAQAATYCDVNEAPRGSAKKRWLRQAISEDRSCDSPQSRPDSPPLSEMVAPPKKRRLPRESLSNEASPPSTPTSTVPPPIVTKLDTNNQQQPPPPAATNNNSTRHEGCVEIVYSAAHEGDSPTHQTLECDAVLKERAAQMKQEYAAPSLALEAVAPPPPPPIGSCLLDPRLARDHHPMFSNSDHLVGAVEKTLSILGFQERRPEAITPAKRKTSSAAVDNRVPATEEGEHERRQERRGGRRQPVGLSAVAARGRRSRRRLRRRGVALGKARAGAGQQRGEQLVGVVSRGGGGPTAIG